MKRFFNIFAFLLAGPLSGLSQTNAPPATFSCVVNPSQTLFPAEQENKAILQVVLHAPAVPDSITRPAVNLCLVLDGSGSMKGAKLEQAKRAAAKALLQLGPRDWFSCIVLGKELETLVPSQQVSDPAAIVRKIRSIKAVGGTSLFGGLSRAASEIRQNSKRAFVHRILVLSDGAANEGPSSARLLERLGISLRKENISVSTIGIGEQYNEDLLFRLADKSDGNFHHANSEAQLFPIFKTEMDDLLNIVAQDVDLCLDFAIGCEPVKVIGRDGRIESNRVNIPMNQLYTGDNTALVEVTLPPSAGGQTSLIANAVAEFRNGITRKVDRIEANAIVGFSTNKMAVKLSEQPDVKYETTVLQAAIGNTDSLQQYNMGNVEEAQRLLQNTAFALDNLNSRFNRSFTPQQTEFVQQQASQFREMEQHVQQQALNAKMQKAYRNDAYQTRRSGSLRRSNNPAPPIPQGPSNR